MEGLNPTETLSLRNPRRTPTSILEIHETVDPQPKTSLCAKLQNFLIPQSGNPEPENQEQSGPQSNEENTRIPKPDYSIISSKYQGPYY